MRPNDLRLCQILEPETDRLGGVVMEYVLWYCYYDRPREISPSGGPPWQYIWSSGRLVWPPCKVAESAEEREL
jgi:hypothetical protein